MPERPFLPFGKAIPEQRAKLSGGGGGVVSPSAAAQKKRLEKKFEDIVAGFKDVASTVDGIEPEQVIVLETLGQSVDNLAKAAAKIPGLEWLAELDLGKVAPTDGFRDADKPDKELSARLYAIMTNQKAMNDLLALWTLWTKAPSQRAALGFGPFKNIFIYLKDVRRWSAQDRLAETGALKDWKENLRYAKKPIRFEVELWCRKDDAARARAFANLQKLVDKEKGRCIAQAAIPEILYHGVLAELPPDAVERTVNKIQANEDTDLLRCEEVMFFRPHGQAAFPISQEEKTASPVGAKPKTPPADSQPVVALLDGYPLAAHERLDGWLRIDDPDDLARKYEPGQQEHGTAMASLILHGDLNQPGEILDRPIYVRPVFVPEKDLNGNLQERTPDDILLVDLFYRAIVRMKGVGNDEGTARSVQIINLSFGNTFQPFNKNVSPLAKLLDWLAWKYNLLFLISAGNQSGSVVIEATAATWQQLSDDELRTQFIKVLWNTQAFRRPFSPAEAINCLTVGAWHRDASTLPSPDRRVDLWKGASMPSPLATVSLGFNQSAKPEIFFAAGRQLFVPPTLPTQEPARFQPSKLASPPGILVGAPGKRPMELNRTTHSCGSSNATALATRCAALAHRRLLQLKGTPGWELLTDEFIPVLLRALLVHGATWGSAAAFIDRVFKPGTDGWQELERVRMRFLGYGEVDQAKTLFATEQRATVLGWDSISADGGHVYSFPLPPSLSAKRVLRRLTVTLAWTTPINPFHSSYRKALLWFSVADDSKNLLKVDKAGLDAKSAQRGTVQHQIFEGESATAFRDGDRLVIKVNCTADAGKMTESIRYGLAVSLEVGPGIVLPIYNEVEARIRQKVPVKPGA
jgi:hypothetical protein